MAIRKLTTRTVLSDIDLPRNSVRPTFSIDFTNTEIVDGRVKFTRNSPATYLGKDGYIKYAAVNQPRLEYDTNGVCKGLLVEPAGTNMFYNSNNISKWTTINGSFWDNCPETLAPDGTYSSTKLTAVNTDPYAYQSFNLVVNAPYTLSFYIKGVGSSINKTGTLRFSGSTYTFTITSDWQRISYNWVCPASNSYLVGIEVPDANAAINDAVYLWGAQLENNNYATSYIPSKDYFVGRSSVATVLDTGPNNSAGVGSGNIKGIESGQERIDFHYDKVNARYVSRGISTEPQVTNYFTYNNNWSSNWSSSTYTITNNNATAPTGTGVATLISCPASQSSTYAFASSGMTAGTYYTFSVFVKQPSSSPASYVRWYTDYPDSYTMNYNFSTGVIDNISGIAANNYGAIPYPDGWVRLWFSVPHPAGAITNRSVLFQLPTSSNIYAWGVQVENGRFPTSYVATAGTAVVRSADVVHSVNGTRAADNASVIGSAFTSGWFNPMEGTLIGEGYSSTANYDTGANPALVSIDDGTGNNRVILRRHSNNASSDPTQSGFTFRYVDTTANIDYFPSPTVLPDWDDAAKHKVALSWSQTSQSAAVDGIDAQFPSTTLTPYYEPTQVIIGNGQSSGYWSGCVSSIRYIPKKLSIEELKTLTK